MESLVQTCLPPSLYKQAALLEYEGPSYVQHDAASAMAVDCAGKQALKDIRAILCPAAMSHATTLKVMERLNTDEFKYEVNIGGPLPLGAVAAQAQPRLRSILWKRRIYPRRSDAEEYQACPLR